MKVNHGNLKYCSKTVVLWKLEQGIHKIAQQVRTLAAESDDLSSTPGTHMMKAEKLCSDFHMYSWQQTCTNTHVA